MAKRKNKNKGRLTEKMLRFAQLYDGKGLETARKAGYTGSNASLSATASKLLRVSKIWEIICARRERLTAGHIANREAQEIFLTEMMYNNTVHKVVDDNGNEKIKMEVANKDRLKAQDQLAKIQGLHQGNDSGGTVTVTIVNPKQIDAEKEITPEIAEVKRIAPPIDIEVQEDE